MSILIIDPALRGKGIGKKLLSDLFGIAKKDNVKKLSINTDESCNYYVYESLGCTRIYETVIENKEYGKLGNISTEHAYIYEKEIINLADEKIVIDNGKVIDDLRTNEY